MRYLYNYGEFLLCIGPLFLIIWIIGLALLWNSLPSRVKKKDSSDEDKDG
ncbi:MAG: hypothetical protein H0V76_02705 [Blastocatellia bacterium]|nr:hypothetical protein [Blastocatellia bacterium]